MEKEIIKDFVAIEEQMKVDFRYNHLDKDFCEGMEYVLKKLKNLFNITEEELEQVVDYKAYKHLREFKENNK